MSFSTLFKSVQFAILNQNGMPITPEQVGLKVKNPAFPYPNHPMGLGNSFASFLNPQHPLTSMIPGGASPFPTPPTPPEDPSNPQQQSQYQQALSAYNQQFQTYQLQMMQMMYRQFTQMQQQMQRTPNNTGATQENLGVGGILDSINTI